MKNIILFFISIAPLCAQDFGYTYYNITDYRSLGVGYNIQNFSPISVNGFPDSLRIRFKTNLPSIEYRELNIRIAVGYQEYTLAGKSLSSFSVYMESGNDFSITSKEGRNGLFIPVKLSANYVKAENPFPNARNFDIGSLGVGAGVKYRFFTQSIGIQVFGMGALHFSNVGFGTEYGSQTSLTGEIQIIIPEIFYDGMIVGYRYERQQWNMNDAILDYKRYYHGPFVGIFF
jgi:hypothetical protein